MTLILNDQDIASVLRMSDCVEVLEEAFREMKRGSAVNAPRRDSLMLSSHSPDSYYSFKTTEGGLEQLGVVAQRVSSDVITYPKVDGVARRVRVPAAPGNRYVGLIFLYSAKTLELLAIMNDGHLQRMRVAGCTGIGVKYLARKDARVAALIGCGWQGEVAAWAIAAVRPLTRIKIFDTYRERLEYLAKELTSHLGIEAIPVGSPQAAVKGADIVATATNSTAPVVQGDWLEPGMHLTSINLIEFDSEAWRRTNLIFFSAPMGLGTSTYRTENLSRSSIRSTEAAPEHEKKLIEQNKDKIRFLPDVLLGEVPGRTSPDQITLMNKNVVLGLEFASVAKLVYDKAIAAGVGREIPSEWFSQTSPP